MNQDERGRNDNECDGYDDPKITEESGEKYAGRERDRSQNNSGNDEPYGHRKGVVRPYLRLQLRRDRGKPPRTGGSG